MKFKSQVFTQASGSIGGQTFSHNKGGMYTRARRTPTNPNTLRQQIVRSAVGGAANMWNALTDAQRAAWKLYGENVPVLNRLGDPIILSGQQQFIRTNSLIASAVNTSANWTDPVPLALTPIAAAPTIFNTGAAPASYTGYVAPGTDGLSIGINLTAEADDDGTLLIYFGRPQNPGRSFYKGPYQLGAYADVSATATQAALIISNADFADFATNIDNPPAAGLWQPVRTVIVYDDGRVSQDFQDFILWGASAP